MSVKRKIIVLSVLAVIAILLLVSSAVFKVKTITVSFASEIHTIEESKIIDASGIKKNSSIFFVNKNKALSNIEKTLPYAKVENIVSEFPNKIIINVSERTDLFLIKHETTENLSYAICDIDLKILKVVSDIDNTLSVLKIDITSPEAGNFVDNGNMHSALLYMQDFTYKSEKIQLNFKEMSFDGTSFIISTRQDKTIKIKNFAGDFKNKIRTVLSIYESVDYQANPVDIEV